jgi:hypothetical protein
MQAIINGIDAIARAMSVAVEVLFRILDAVIEAVARVSIKIVDLIRAMWRLLWYTAPFIGIIVIGNIDDVFLLQIVGYAVLAFVCLLLVREFLAEATRFEGAEKVSDPADRSRIVMIIFWLNILIYGYLICRFHPEIISVYFKQAWNYVRSSRQGF